MSSINHYTRCQLLRCARMLWSLLLGLLLTEGLGQSVSLSLISQWPGAVGERSVMSIAVVGSYCYVPDPYAGELHVLDLKDPAHPQRIAGYLSGQENMGQLQKVWVSAGYAYFPTATYDVESGWTAVLQVIDVSTPTAPVLAGSFEVAGTHAFSGMAFSGNYGYAVGQTGFLVLDVTDPARPARVGGLLDAIWGLRLSVSGSHAFVSEQIGDPQLGPTQGQLTIIDISDPKSPRRVGAYDGAGPSGGDLVVSGNTAYWTWGRTLEIIDISDPTNPQSVGRYDTSGSAMGVAVMGKHALLTEWSNPEAEGGRMHVIDVADPSNPKKVAEWTPAFDSFAPQHQIVVRDDLVFVTDWNWSLHVLQKELELSQQVLLVFLGLGVTAENHFPSVGGWQMHIDHPIMHAFGPSPRG